MKIRLKSSLNLRLALHFGFLCLLCGCADAQGVNWLTGEPSSKILDAPRIVKKPERADSAAWPNLADVPLQKPVFSDLESRRQASEELRSDGYQAEAESVRIRDIVLPSEEEYPALVEGQILEKPFSALRP